MDAYGIFFFLIIAISTSSSSSNTFKLLFPDETKLYTYSFFTNVSSIIKSGGDGSYWTLGGRMDVQVLDGFSRARFRLDELKSTVYNRGSNTSEQLKEHAEFLKKPWEVGVCFNAIHTDAEPVWVTNIKRALSFNFLFTESKNSLSTYHSDEPCIHGNCIVVYSPMGSKTRKYYSLIDSKRSRQSTYEQKCLPNGSPENWYRPSYSEDTNNVMSAERLYVIHKTEGLKSLELQSEYQYKSGEHLLSVATVFTLTLSSTSPAVNTQKQNLSSSHLQYASQTHGDPYNGIWKPTQTELKDTTFKNLLEIAKKGIDADNIVRNATLIHSLDFIELLNTMSQLTLTSLQQLFEDVLGTSYELETARNIFLEILPYVRTEDCARLVRHLVMEQKNKIEDAMLVSLIRKLPYTKIEYSKPLLEELEVFTKLGPDFPKEIRHAGVLSFASLVHKTMEVSFDQQYYDEVYDKYLRMYNTCPQYSDRLVWLQGLTNIGKSVVNYLDEIQTDSTKDRHERLWAALASLNIWRGSSLENTLPILMNDTEHIQLRIMALHGFLSSPMGARDLVNVHNYILNCDNQQLKKFWFSTVKNLERNRFYHRYKSASYYIPFIANQVSYPGEQHWATNNYLVGEELSLDSQGPTFQLLTVGGPWNGVPEMALAEFSTGAENTFNVNIYIIAEGVAQNVFQRLLNLNEKEQNLENIKDDLKKLNIKIIEANKVHIDVIVKVQDKTVYATHIDEAKFDTWNADDVKRSIEDFVRFGSHINQQMVYYPIQSVKNFGTEIGTPIRLQSTIVSFTSIRGNLTAPLEEELIWRNDLHIRNQRTSLTSLSTDGPLQPSEHISKIQQSMVLHLPFKLDLKVLPNDKSIELLWTNPSQNGGVAIHSRSQVGVRSKSDKEMYNVANEGLNRDDGIFFDCDRAFSIPDLSQIFFARSYDILTSIQPSHFILNILRLITIPSSGSCGIILPPKQLQTGNKVKLEVNLEEFALRIDDIITNRDVSDGNEEKNCGNENFDGGNDTNVVDAKVSYALSYYRDSGDNADVDTYLSIKGSAALMSNEEKSEININLKSHQSEFGNENDWLFCVDVKQTPICQEGNLNVAFSSGANCSCLSPDSKLTVKYKSLKDSKGRKLEAEISSFNIPKLEVKPNVEQSALTYLLRILSHITSSYNSTTNLEIKERNGFTSISMDGNEKMELRSNVFSWVPGSATVLQVLKRYGFYHKCTIKGPIYERASMGAWYEEKLLLGECTPKPRFEIISPYPDLFTFTTGKENIYVTGKPLVGDDLKVKTKGNSTIIISQSTGVIVIVNNSKHLYKEMTIYIPQPLMNSVCGICTEPPYLNS